MLGGRDRAIGLCAGGPALISTGLDLDRAHCPRHERGTTLSAREHRHRQQQGQQQHRGPWSRVFGLDLVLLHAPSVWDFRAEVILQGPLADVIPSTDEFEMYPIGLTSIAAYLEANHYNTRLVNLAYRMLRDKNFDVAHHLAKLDAPVFGIDLHWLPHANGALGIAELVKQVHPDAKVLMGGLSASWFHEEVIANPAVDFVLRGDSTEEPCRQLLAALRDATPLEAVENLTWKRPDGTSSRTGYRVVAGRRAAAMRSPEKLVADAKRIATFSRAPIFMVHDPRFGADPRLQFYVAPLGPFLDPGSRAFEDPDLGYHKRFTTLEEHRQALIGPTWREMLSYETAWMTRAQIVETTYAVGAGLNDVKLEAGLIDAATHASVARHFAIAKETFPKVDAIAALEASERADALRALAGAVDQANTASLVGEHELEWKTTAGLRMSLVLARHTAAALPREVAHGLARLLGRYDSAIAEVCRPNAAP